MKIKNYFRTILIALALITGFSAATMAQYGNLVSMRTTGTSLTIKAEWTGSGSFTVQNSNLSVNHPLQNGVNTTITVTPGTYRIVGTSTLAHITLLDVNNNNLDDISLTGCVYLKYLYCRNNSIPSLDVSNCPALLDITCDNNKLTSLNISVCTALRLLECWGNKLTELNIDNYTALYYLDCGYNELTELNVWGCTALKELYCENNKLTSLTVSNKTSLEQLHCSDNKLTQLIAYGCTNLNKLNCRNNNLHYLDIGRCTSLTDLIAHDQYISVPRQGLSDFPNPISYTLKSGSKEDILIVNDNKRYATGALLPYPDSRYELSFTTTNTASTQTSNVYSGTILLPGFYIPVTSITVSQANLILYKGNFANLSAVVLPSNASNNDISWRSSNNAVATVNSSGVVTAVSPGTAIITAFQFSDDCAPGTCTVSVPSDPIVGSQSGTMTAGVGGRVTYQVTMNNNPGTDSRTVTVTNLPSGVTVDGAVTITNNSGTLTLVGDASVKAGTTSNLKMNFRGLESNTFSLTVAAATAPTTITVIPPEGYIYADEVSDVNLKINATNFPNNVTPQFSFEGLPACFKPEQEFAFSNNVADLMLEYDGTRAAGTINNIILNIEGGITSPPFSLTLSPPPTVAILPTALTNMKVGTAVDGSILYTLSNGNFSSGSSFKESAFRPLNLPAGLTITGTVPIGSTQVLVGIRGTPTAPGTFTIPDLPANTVYNRTKTITPSGTTSFTVSGSGTTTTPAIAVTSNGLTNLQVGKAVSGANIIYTLTNGTYASPITAANFAVTNLPKGLTAGTAQRTSNTVVTVTITGTPTNATATPIAVTLPTAIPISNISGASGSEIKPSGAVEIIRVDKGAGAAVTKPTLLDVTAVRIRINAVTVSANQDKQEAEYAYSENTTTPTSGWQESTVFGSLKPNTGYYIFARSKESDNLNAGAVQRSDLITTAAAPSTSVTVGQQNGTMTAGTTGEVTFGLTTVGIDRGSHSATVGNLPQGVTVKSNVSLTPTGTGTLTLVGNNSTAAGAYSNLTLTINGVTSSAFTLTISPAGTVTTPAIVAAGNGLTGLTVGQVFTTANPASVTFTLSNGTYASTITPADFTISNLPPGLTAGTAQRTNGTVVTVPVTGTLTTATTTPRTITLPTSIPVTNISGASGSAIIPSGTVVASAIAKGAGAAVSAAPTVNGNPTQTSITVNAVTITGSNPGGQRVEYAISTSTTAPTSSSDWQRGTTFSPLSSGTAYYVFARSNDTTNYAAGAAQRSAAISTAASTTATPPAITTTALPSGSEGSAYSTTLAATGSGPITWSLQSGNLPTGLTLASDGQIAGTPTTSGTSTFTVRAVNSAGSDTKALSIVISPPVGNENVRSNQLKVYPSPFTDEVHITGADRYEQTNTPITNRREHATTLRIFNSFGVLVRTQQLTSPDETLRLGSLPAGMYFFRFESDGKAVTVKVIKK